MDDIEVVIRASVAELQAGMASAATTVTEATSTIAADLEALAATSAETSEAVINHFTNMQGIVLAFAGYEGLKAVISAAEESERAFVLVESQIRATGAAAGFTADQMRDYAMALERSTTFSHAEVEDLEARLMAFTNITGAQFTRAIQTILDFASVTGRDPVTAVRTLGVALEDPTTGMGRLRQAGIALTEAQKDQIIAMQDSGDLMGAQNKLLDALEGSYSGAAAAVRGTFGGALDGLKHQLADDVEGGPGSFSGATAAVNRLTDALKDPAIEAGIGAIASAISGLISLLAKAASGIGDLVQGYERLESADLTAKIQSDTRYLQELAARGEQATQAYKDLEDQIRREANEELNGGIAGVGPAAGGAAAAAPVAAPGTVPAGQNQLGTVDDFSGAHMQQIDPGQIALLQQNIQAQKDLEAAMDQTRRTAQAEMDANYQAAENAIASAKELQQAWESALQPISDAFATTVDGVIRGTETWHQGMHKMFDSILEEFISSCVKMTVQWVATEAAKTQASIAGSSTRTAVSTSAAGISATADASAASTSILADAWKAAAAVYASVAEIPYVGWILAPAMALAAAAEVGSWVGRIASAEGGWGNIPSDQLAMVHKNEMILPAGIATPMRQAAAAGQLGGGSSTNINISALDTRSFMEALSRNPGAVMKAVRRGIKMGHG